MRKVAAFVLPLVLLLCASPLASQARTKISLTPSADSAFMVASLPTREAPLWSVNGQPRSTTTVPERFLLPSDGSALSAEGLGPRAARSLAFEAGRWGMALRLREERMLAYPREGILDLDEGTVEFWLCPIEDGASSRMASPTRLFAYEAPGGDFLQIAVSDKGVLHGGAIVAGAWESAYSETASVRGWKAGEWHHLLFAWSAKASTMEFYLDGTLAGATNEGHYVPPDGRGGVFLLGSPLYRMDSVRIWNQALGARAAAFGAARQTAPGPRESTLFVGDLRAGDRVSCAQAGQRESYDYRGPALFNPFPAEGILPPGSEEVEFSLESLDPSTCRYSIGSPLPWAAMTESGEPGPTLVHRFRVKGLSADPATTNEVFVRCAATPEFFLRLRWRSLPTPQEGYPRIANLWYDGPLDRGRERYLSRLGLIVPSNYSPGRDILRAMHRENPHAYILATVQSFEYFEGEAPVPESWYLKDLKGERIRMWPGSFRLNMTLPEVVEFNAQRIRRALIESDYLLDGAFFDSFSPEPGMDRDCYGKPLQVDADNDGRPDDPETLRRAWRSGVLGIVARFKELEPHAIMTGHLGESAGPDFGRYFHGDNIAFASINVIEGRLAFAELKARYDEWFEAGRLPSMTVIDCGAPNRLGYGYGVYSSWEAARAGIPPGVLEFARTWYPAMRFGLGLTLMGEGYFERHFSDVLYCVDWWYDEFEAALGKALGPAYLAIPPAAGGRELVRGGDMEGTASRAWQLWADSSAGAEATLRSVELPASAASKTGRVLRVDIARAGSADDDASHKINLYQEGIRLEAGRFYELSFRARAEGARTIAVSLQRRAGDWEDLGLWSRQSVDGSWREIRLRFVAKASRSDAGLQFFLAGSPAAVELDEVSLREAAPEVWRRDFEGGTALVNGTGSPRILSLPAGFSRLKGNQAPRWQYIVDEDSKDRSFSGSWKTLSYDTPEWQVEGPFYHSWGGSCREASASKAQTEWKLNLPEDGSYTIKAWFTKAPTQASWSRSAIYEVVSRGRILATTRVDQSACDDAWVEIARLRLSKADAPILRLRNEGSGVLYADAILIESEARYNDGSPAREILLGPYDGIVLTRESSSRGLDTFGSASGPPTPRP